MNQLTKAFQDALCVEQVPAGSSILCGCEISHKATLEAPVFSGAFAGITIVKGCCEDASSSFGNMLWGHRHIAARFLRGMCVALAADNARLIDTLPPAMGAENWSGLRGTICGARYQCTIDYGTTLQVIGEGRMGRETVMRAAFTPDPEQV